MRCWTTNLSRVDWELTVVLDYYDAMETYSRIGLLRSYGNLRSYWTTTKLWKLTVVLNYHGPIFLEVDDTQSNEVDEIPPLSNFDGFKSSKLMPVG
jgi:hypothetical protein